MRTQKNLKSSRPSKKKPGAGSRRWPGYYDVVIIPPAHVCEHAIDLSRRLQGNWVLGKHSFIPHISLYHIPVLDQDFSLFTSELDRLVSESPLGRLEITGFDMPVLTVNKPKWLDTLHRRIVRRTVQYFDRTWGAEETWGLDFFSGRRREFAKRYLRRYGTPMFGMNFRPHITLTSFKGSAPPPAFELKVKTLRFDVRQLTVCELGESHSCQRKNMVLSRPLE